MRTGTNGEWWQTTVRVPYSLHLEKLKHVNVSYSKILAEVLKEKFYYDVETREALRKKLTFFAGKLAELQGEMRRNNPLSE